MDGLVEAILFLALAGVISVVAVRIGMLVAPRLDRLTQPDDEDAGGHDD